MKLAIDIREATRGKKAGKGWYTYQLVRALLKKDTKNEYLLYTDRPFPEWSAFPNATQRFFPPSSILWHYRTLQDLKKINPDIFWAPTSYIIPAFAPTKLKTVLTVHDLVAWISPQKHQKKATFIEQHTLPSALKKTSRILAVSKNTKKDVQNFFQIPDEKISIIPCAASEIFQPSPRKELDLPEKFILAVGTLEPRKNYVNLIKSFALTATKHPELKLIIIGGKGWHYDEILQTVRGLKLQEKIFFADYVSEQNLLEYYNRALMLVYPSLYEGFGMPPLEAMQCGCPVVAGNTSSLPEVVGNAALLVDPRDTGAIAEKIEMLLRDRELREQLKEKGLGQAKKYSWEKSADSLLEAFSRI